MADPQKPSNLEDEYFAREEIEQKRKLALKQANELALAQREQLKALHQMKCPRCGLDLHALKRGAIVVDTCFSCRGLWLDAGELEHLVSEGSEQNGAVMKAVLGIFGRK